MQALNESEYPVKPMSTPDLTRPQESTTVVAERTSSTVADSDHDNEEGVQATDCIQTTLEKSESPDLWNNWSTLQYAAGEVRKAEEGYRRCLLINPSHREAAVNLGILLLANGRPEEAAGYLLSVDLNADEAATVKRLRIECAQKLQMNKFEAAIEFLLIQALNSQASRTIGESSNRALTAQFMKFLIALKPSYFLDIGANDGCTARVIKKIQPACEVWAFEANPQIHQRFAPLLAGTGANYVNLAIAEKSGPVKIYAPRTLSQAVVDGEIIPQAAVESIETGKTSIYRRTEVSTYAEFVVEAVCLDDFMALRKIPLAERTIALWIDVEGAAFEVLSGAKVSLTAVSIIMIESENHEFWAGQKQCGDIARLLIAAGFVPIDRDREYGDKQFNTVFVHHSFLDLLYADNYRLGKADASKQETAGGTAGAPEIHAEQKRNIWSSIAAHAASRMPVFVPVFNNPTYARMMLRQLSRMRLTNIHLVDNGSTYPPMLRFLEEAERQVVVIRHEANLGPRETVLSAINSGCVPDIFCVTDPDLEFGHGMPEDFLAQLASLTETYKLGKAGVALRLDDAHLMHRRKFSIIGKEWHVTEWESQFWKEPMDPLKDGSPVFRAIIDTTFAVYNKRHFTPNSFYLGARVAGNYTCRHLPWYQQSGVPKEEEDYYRATQKYSLHVGGVADTRASGIVRPAGEDAAH